MVMKEYIQVYLDGMIGMLKKASKNRILYQIIKRIMDITLSIIALFIFIIPFIIIFFLIKFSSKGDAIYWSERIGQNNKIFKMPKFRTMHIDTPPIATHLLDNPDKWVTPIGKILRKYSLDEVPQIWSIISGKMSIVGPRPALYNQNDLISLRKKYNIHTLVPGLTGLAQIKGRDILSIEDKVKVDKEYLEKCSLTMDLNIILVTIKKVFISENVNH